MDIELPKRRINRKAVALSMAILVGLIVSASWINSSPAVPVEELRIGIVSRGKLVQKIRSIGTLEPTVQRRISSRGPGEVVEALVEPGDEVSKDDVLLTLANADLEGELLSVNINLAAAQADLAATRLELNSRLLEIESSIADFETQLQIAEERMRAEDILRAKGVISGIEFATTQAEVNRLRQKIAFDQRRASLFGELIEARIDSEEAKIREIRRSRDRLREQVEGLSVRAGIDGIVQKMSVEAGEAVADGIELAVVSQERPLRVRLQVPQGQAQLIAVGVQAVVDIRGEAVTGVVTLIAPLVTDGTVDVLVSLPGEVPPSARVALSVEAEIQVERRAEVLWLPRPNRLPIAESIAEMFVLNSDGDIAERRFVEVGITTADAVEILGGLSAGDKVVLRGPDELFNRSAFRIAR